MTNVSADSRRCSPQLDHRQFGNQPKMAYVPSHNGVAEIDCCRADQKIGEWNRQTSVLRLAVYLSCHAGRCKRERFHWQRYQDFLNEFDAARLKDRILSPPNAMQKFYRPDRRQSRVRLSASPRELFHQFIYSPLLPLGRDDNTRVYDYSHDEDSGSWQRIKSSNSALKAASRVAFDPSASRRQSDSGRPRRSAGRMIAIGLVSRSTTTSEPESTRRSTEAKS